MTALAIIMQFLFIIGFCMIVIAVVQTYSQSPNPRVVYRYVPRTFIEDQENPVPLDDIFYTMFNNPTPWVASVDIARKRKDIGENLNKYYVTQI